MFPNFLVPRPTKLTQEEIGMVRYYKSVRNKILEETPFYITGMKRSVPVDDEDDGTLFIYLRPADTVLLFWLVVLVCIFEFFV
jgi:hypothetical protein